MQCNHLHRNHRSFVPLRHPNHTTRAEQNALARLGKANPVPVHLLQLALWAELCASIRRALPNSLHDRTHDACGAYLSERADFDFSFLYGCTRATLPLFRVLACVPLQ